MSIAMVACKYLVQLLVVANVSWADGCNCLEQMSLTVACGCKCSQSDVMVACKCLAQLFVIANVSWAVVD